MRIAVCLKQILDPQTIKVSRSRQAIDERRARRIMNPPDRQALDVALRLKESDSSHEVVALSLGPAEVEDVLREALALGCDRAILISDAEVVKATTAGVARVLATAIQRLEDVHLVLTGQAALDTGDGTLGPRLAVELGDWPVLMAVERLHIEGGYVSGLEHMDAVVCSSRYPLPAVATLLARPQPPRYAHGAEIINAYRKREVEVWSSAVLGIDPATLPTPTAERYLRLPPEREYGVMLEGTPTEAATALLAALKARRTI